MYGGIGLGERHALGVLIEDRIHQEDYQYALAVIKVSPDKAPSLIEAPENNCISGPILEVRSRIAPSMPLHIMMAKLFPARPPTTIISHQKYEEGRIPPIPKAR